MVNGGWWLMAADSGVLAGIDNVILQSEVLLSADSSMERIIELSLLYYYLLNIRIIIPISTVVSPRVKTIIL